MDPDFNYDTVVQMRGRVALFRRGAFPLHELVSELEIMIGSLQSAPTSWVDRALAEWAALEEANALLLEREEMSTVDAGKVQDDFAGPIGDSLSELERLFSELAPPQKP